MKDLGEVREVFLKHDYKERRAKEVEGFINEYK